MFRLTLSLLMMMTLVFAVGCSDDDPVSSNNQNTPPNNSSVVTTYNSAGGYYESVVNASGTDEFVGLSFADNMGSAPKVSGLEGNWDVGFRREVIKLNGGASSTGGTALGVDLGAVDFDMVDLSDTTGLSWVADAVDLFIDEWYDYNFVTHQITVNGNVYSMLDAEGDNYVKFRIDSLAGAGAPPSMGTVHITYFYQPTANSTDLSGATTTAAITVGAGTGYFDFSTGSQVTPADPSGSTDWDLAFSSYDVMQNSGPNGPGSCGAFPAFGEIADPTDIDAFTAQPASPLFPDIPSSSLTEWYNYDGQTHTLNSKGNVYLINSGTSIYKMEIVSYYKEISGVRTSGYYTLRWNALQ